MKHFLIVGNWKMNLGPKAAKKFVGQLQHKVDPHTHVINVLCPPFISLPVVSSEAEFDTFRIGAQNIHPADEGAYTGEVSGPMIAEFAQYVIVGHSERRRDFHEDDKLVGQKVAAGIRSGLKVILCVGEKLSDRNEKHSGRVVVDQLHGALAGITADDMKQIVVAYEPVWAIGTGRFATPEEITPVTTIIRQTIEELYGEGASSHLQILYGGSVDGDNCRAYLSLEHIDGLLVGGASLKVSAFSRIIATAQSLAK